ncbi:hypothetical protein [Rhodanobacter sp. L36]|uniref:hypothetical protein n=1 Tax=Rhodanobacter sp. L36 TaxID=1747221 RepID=UPI00131C4FEC|nr:hypothetical protein [Rhodanobacter sp. L36]
MTSYKVYIKAGLILIVGVLFAIWGPIELVAEGPFSWAVKQPGAWQGAIELAVLAMLIGCATYYLHGWKRWLLLLLLCAAYSRRQGVDFAVLGSLIYFEGIVSLGFFIYRRFVRIGRSVVEDHLMAIAIGLLTWSCIEWTISAFGLGSLRDLEYAAAVILGGALLLERRAPMLALATSRLRERNIAAALSCSFVCVVVLMLFAKSAISIGYDSLWYGMRGDRLLVSSGSVFHGLGLVAPIHYAPQAYELLLIPLSALHSVPGIFGFAIWCVLALGFCLFAVSERLGWKSTLSLVMVAVALSTPAVLNAAITAKGDVLAAFWIFFGIHGFISYRQSKDWRWLILMLAAALAAVSYRMSSFIYAGLLASIGVFYLVKDASKARPSDMAPLKLGIWLWVSVAALILFALVTTRTYLLAGIPFIEPGVLVRVAEKIGFVRQFPAGNAPPQDIRLNHEIFTVLFDLVFRPGRMSHIVISWTGAAWAFFLLIGLWLNRFKLIAFSELGIFWLFSATWFAILLLVYFPDRGGDGNYFIVPVLCLIILGIAFVGDYLLHEGVTGRSLRSVVSIFAVSSILVALVTGSWGPGTYAFDLKFNRPPRDLRGLTDKKLTYYGMLPISNFLRSLPRDTRVVSVVPPAVSGEVPDSWLPVRNESLLTIYMFMPTFAQSPQAIKEFLIKDRIQYVMLPTKSSKEELGALYLIAKQAVDDLSAKHQARIVVTGDRFTLWKLN